MLRGVPSSSHLDQRILEAVGVTVYAEGINASGVDRLSEAAQVSKRTLYQHFKSKDALVARSLEVLDDRVFGMLTAPAEAARRDGRSEVEQILAVFGGLRDMMRHGGYRGCPFLNARAELADRQHPAHAVVDAHKDRLRRWFESTARRGGLRSAPQLGRQLLLVYDGAIVAAPADRSGRAAADARAVAATLLRAAAGSRAVGE
jgi:AcrR family transcriptional regulator